MLRNKISDYKEEDFEFWVAKRDNVENLE